MSLIVQLSDTHFGTELPLVVEAAQRALSELNPDVVLISGDLTQRATPSQFKSAAEFFKGLPGQVKFVIPGNHDLPLFNLPLRIFDPYRNYLREFRSRQGTWTHQNIAIIGYDAPSRWRHTRGELTDAVVIERVKEAKAKLTPSGILIACAHQPLYTAWREDMENVLVHAEHTANLFSRVGVDIVLSGHVHVPVIQSTEDVFKDLPRHFLLSGAGTAVSHRTRRGLPNSFNVIRVEESEVLPPISITLMEYVEKMNEFIPHIKRAFRLGESGWRLEDDL